MCVSFANFSASNGSPVSPPLGLRVRLVTFGPVFAGMVLGILGFFWGGAFGLDLVLEGDEALRFGLAFRGSSSSTSSSPSTS